jgi:hypothetical protein
MGRRDMLKIFLLRRVFYEHVISLPPISSEGRLLT